MKASLPPRLDLDLLCCTLESSRLIIFSPPVFFSADSLIHRLHFSLHLHTQNTQLHKQSTTLKRTPMRHVTGSLCRAACLLDINRLNSYSVLLLWAKRRQEVFVCAPTHTGDVCSSIHNGVVQYQITKCVYVSGERLKVKPLLKNMLLQCMNKSPLAQTEEGHCV